MTSSALEDLIFGATSVNEIGRGFVDVVESCFELQSFAIFPCQKVINIYPLKDEEREKTWSDGRNSQFTFVVCLELKLTVKVKMSNSSRFFQVGSLTDLNKDR